MAMLGRRFVNIVAAGKYKTGLLSVHRLDASKDLFYPSASEARFVGGGDDEVPLLLHALPSLPAPFAVFSDATSAAARSRAFMSLISPRSRGSRILFINEAGDSIVHYADEGCPTGHTMPGPAALEDFAGPVAASVSVVAGKEESMYVVHGVHDGDARFHVLRFGMTPDRWGGSSRVGEGWYWQSLPPPPFALGKRDAEISSYTVVEGGRTICVSWCSSSGDDAASWCFDTVRGEWWHAGDWVMPFDGRAEYLADLDLWLGFTSFIAGSKWCTRAELCTTSGLSLSAMAMNQPPTLLQHLWRDVTPKHQLVELINLGSGRFAIARMFHEDDGYTSDYDSSSPDADQILVITGVEIRPRQPRHGCNIWSSSDGLELILHKSVTYMCDVHRIHQVL